MSDDRERPMQFPDRRGGRQYVIVVPPKREHGDKEQPRNARVRIYA